MANRETHSTYEWTIPLKVSVSLGVPILTEPHVFPLTSPSPSRNADELTREGLFSSSRPAAIIAPFHLASLTSQTFTWKAALSMALASKLAYESAAAVTRTTLEVWKFDSCELIDVDDTQCFLATTSEVSLVSFRGTESRGDWLRNVNVPGRTRDYGVVHRGFLGAFQAVESRLRSVLSGLSARKLILTGHSLGGALATVMAAEWQGVMPEAWVVTFGQPAVGSGAFRMFFLQHYSGKFFRFVNDGDIVPRVPPGYEHVGRLLHFDAKGNLKSGQLLSATDRVGTESLNLESFEQGPPMLTESEYHQLQSQLGSTSRPVGGRFNESTVAPGKEGFFPNISDHSMDKYIAKIAAKAAM